MVAGLNVRIRLPSWKFAGKRFAVQTGNDEMHEGLFPFPDGVECPLWVISGH